MSSKRSTSRRLSGGDHTSQKKRPKTDNSDSYLHKTLQESGLTLKNSPDKCVVNQEVILVIRNIKKNLQKHFEYPRNVSELFSDLEKECQNVDIFKHYLFPNIVRITEDTPEEHPINDSVLKILLSIPILQNKLIDFIFEKAIDLAAESKCGPWIQIILKCLSSLNFISDTDKISTNLINLLDITSEKMVRLEIITAIPDIVGDREHSNIATEMSRILSEDHELIPAILDCLSYLCLSDDQYEQLQKKTLTILMTLSKFNYFANFVKFLLLPGRTSDTAYFEAVQGLRNALGWPTTIAKQQDIASSQVLTATAIRNSMISSKLIANCWLKVITNCKTSTDHKAIDFILLLILYSTSEDKQKQVENTIRKQIKLNILKEELLVEAFEKFKPILKDHLKNLIDLTNTLLKTKSDPMVESFASHTYTLMLSHLDDSSQTIVAELLQLGLDSKQCIMSILIILNNVATKDMSVLKPQSLQMLTLLDRMDAMSLAEIRAVMDLICGMAYSSENSIIRDDIHMIIRKELSSSNPTIKIQGILAGIHAIKYLMATNADEENTIELPDDISYSSVTHLAEGDLREAAQVIELISRSTKQFPDMTAFFYDELSKVVKVAPHINKHFMSWLTDAVTNDLQLNFIVESIETERVGELNLTMQFCLNEESEMDEVLAINIGGHTLKSKEDVVVGILSPLFQLVQTLHSRQHEGNLSSIDALLGCPVVMPKFDIDLIEDLDHTTVKNILDCLIHCVNWFRELLNAFATQTDEALKRKILHRVVQIEQLEKLIGRILITSKLSYKPPICTFNINKYQGEATEKRPAKTQISKQKGTPKSNAQDDTVLPETAKSQPTQNVITVNTKLFVLYNLPLRPLGLQLLQLLNTDMSADNEPDANLTIKTFTFLIKCINDNLEKILISKIKKKSFLTKQENFNDYDPKKAEECARLVGDILPKMMEHLEFVKSYIDSQTEDNTQNESGYVYTSEMIEYLTCLEYMYSFFTTYFKWIGFKNHHSALLKSSLRTIVNGLESVVSLKDLLLKVAKILQKHEKYCLQLSTAVSLIEFMKAIQDFSDSSSLLKILRDMAQRFLSQQWKTPDGLPEKGFLFNQSIDRFTSIFFLNNEIIALKNLTLQLNADVKVLKSKNDTLTSFKSINKGNFPILYRNLGTALHESTKSRLEKGLINCEHLVLWKDVATTLKHMSDIAKTLETRNNLAAFFKKSLPVLKLFLSQGVPILELQFKDETQEVLEILKILQQSTRFLQSLCCHSRLKKDTALMSKVPYMRQLLETLIYKVKAALAANNCSEAFWMGNLKNKNIHGEVIATQQSIESEEGTEDCDDQLPDDDSDSDDEMNPDSNSVSDIV
ncbi:hypothetical protein O0L34_g8262 [Tuta absoluta]|nr:hypothetical protein O0L34_g8262 [Tuta absoluta]